jgi:hypothetical protein
MIDRILALSIAVNSEDLAANPRTDVVAQRFHAEGAENRGGAEKCRSLDSLRSLGMTGYATSSRTH